VALATPTGHTSPRPQLPPPGGWRQLFMSPVRLVKYLHWELWVKTGAAGMCW